METSAQNSRIKILPPQEARRIAAGEVIDRPAALIREFLDNAIDSGAANIEISIVGGGSKKAEVVDDGQGMSREDLELCWLAHATSKITCLDDLDTTRTLGFRGEALAAASAVAQLEIISSVDGREAWQLEVGPGENNPPKLSHNRRVKGSTVRALGLFDTIPARKRFLKRETGEAALCRQAFIDKALVFPRITFRFTQDGRSKDFFPAAASKKERFAAVLLKPGESGFLHEVRAGGAGFSVDVVIGGPELSRNDKRSLFIFTNGRRIQDYALTQAVIYGTQGWFPNGTMPIGAAFIDIDPALADFNIHPAKREVRFRDPAAIHHAVSAALSDFCRHYAIKTAQEKCDNTRSFFTRTDSDSDRRYETRRNSDTAGYYEISPHTGEALAMKALLETRPDFAALPGQSTTDGIAAEAQAQYGEPRYAGRIFGLFILIEWNDRLFIIDQHAAHERILYNEFISGTIPRQELLVPIPFSTESDDEDRFLEAHKEQLGNLGLAIEKDGSGWRIDALPSGWRMGDLETVRKILELPGAGENMAMHWAASLCCHLAVRDGDYLDEESALALAKQALQLPEPRCPHGRPIWTEISRGALLKAVKRL